MAKKDVFTLDEFGFEKELDFGDDFDFEIQPPKDDRKAVTKAAVGFSKGAKDAAFSNQFVKRFVKKALPKGYGDAMEMAGEGIGEASKLYNSTVKELKPTIKELKRVTGRALPNVEGKIPKKLADKLKAWSDSGKEESSGQTDFRESSIAMQLGEVFQEQIKEASKQQQQNEVGAAIRDNMAQKRHADIFEQLEGIRLSATRLSTYQDKVTVNFQRKSLELQYRQYYILSDMLEEHKKANEQFKTNLGEIVKNTGLPEYAKIQNSERLGEMMRNKFMGNIYETIFDKRRGYFGKAVNRLGTRIKDKVTDFAGDLQNGLSAADMMLDAGESAREMGMPGMDKYEMAGNVAGGMAMNSMGERLGAKAGQWINKSRFGKKIRTLGSNLEYATKNVSQIGDKFSRGDYDYDDGLAGKIIATMSKLPGGEMALEALKDAAYSGRPDQSFKVDGIKDMQGPAVFSNQTRKSINEVIPGFLARIYQELQIIRTGDDKVGLMEYDFGGNKFVSAKALMGSIMSKVVSKDQTARFQDDNDELIKHIDPEGKLSKKERGELGKFFLSDNFKNGLADPKRFADSSEFRGVSRETAMKAAQLFQQSFGIDEFGGIEDKENFAIKRNKFSNSYSGLGMGFSDNREMIQNLLNLGHHDVIRQLGLMNEKGEFDPDKLYGYMSGDVTPELNDSPLAGKGKPKRMRGRRKAQQQAQQVMAQNHYAPSAEREDDGTAHESLETLKQILDMIEKSNNRAFIENIANTSMRIEAIMMEGIFRNGETGRNTMGEGEKRRWYQASIGDILGGSATGISKGMKYIGRQLDKAAKGAVNLGTTVMGKATSMGMKGVDWLTKKRDELCDIYLTGEATPRIQAWRLKAGHYIDQKTGEVIKKISDIKGTVIDKDGNVILSLEDMKNIIPPDGRSKLKQAFDGMIGLGKKGLATITGSYDAAWQLAKQAGKTAKSLIMRVVAKDVYVVGEEEPRLLAITMRVGGYHSKITGKTIWKPLQIDGPVLNSEGEVVLSDADLRKGIVDASGNPFKSMISKAMAFGKSVVGGTIKNIKKAAKWTAGKAVDAVDIVTQFIKNGMGIESSGGIGGGGFNFGFGGKSNSKTMVERLTEIRDLLKDRLPERKKKVLGDADGDGDRENSWQDNAQKRDAAQKAGDGKSGIGKGKTVGGLTAAAAAAAKKKEDEAKEDEDDMGLTDAAAAMDLAKTGWGGLKKGGGKVLGWGKKLAGKVGLKGLGLAGAAYGGYSAYDNLKNGNYGEAALDSGIAAGGLAMTYGGGAAATTAAAGTGIGAGIMGAVGTGLAAAGSAALGILSSPVVLGALAVAAVGGAGYYGYKALTSKKLKTLSTYRFAQYGFTSKDTDALQKVFSLEDRLMDSVVYENGIAKLKEGKVTMKDMLDVMSINESNKKMVFRFEQWFQGRFKPVFLTHLTALKSVSPSCKLDDVDSKLKPEEKKKYFDASRFQNGPYSTTASPIEDRAVLSVTGRDVENAGKVCEEAIKKELGDKKSETGIEEGKTSAVATATALATQTPDGQEIAKPANEGEYGLSLATKSQDGYTRTAVNAVKRTTGIGSETGIGLIMAAEVVNDEKQISPLNAIRYRTYGLFELELPKINNLLTLEQTALEMMKFTGDSVAWDGDVDRVIDRCGGKFGVTSYNTPQGQQFSMWFNARFLPVFKNYVSTVYLATGKKNIREAVKVLTPTQILAVANAVYTTRTDYNGRSNVPVWKVPQSPWADYVINTNEATVHDSVKALTAKAKDDVVAEKVPVKKADALTEPTLDKDKAQAEKNASLWDKTKDMFGKAGSWISEKAGKAWDAVKSGASAVGSGISNVASSAATKAKEYASQGMSAVTTTVNNVAAGIGGMIDSIPMPTKGGSYAALKDTISAASKMVGVDEKLMAIMAAIESGFNYAVKAGTSSATGLYQFIDSTWKYMVKNYGAKYGIAPGTSPQDPRANAVLGAEFLKMNMERLAPTLGRAPTYTDMYLAHFMGDGGAKKFLRAMKENPNAIGAEIFPKEAAANKPIFFEDKGNGRPRTLQEIYNHFSNMISKKAQSFKIDVGAGMQQAANDPKANTPAGAPPDVGTGVAPGTDPKAGGGVANATATATGGAAPVAAGNAPASATGSKTAEMIAADSKAPRSTAPAAPVSASPVQAGFSQTPPQQIAQQQQASKDDFSKSIGAMDKSLLELVEIQRSAKGTLESILQVLQTSGAGKLPNAADSTNKGPAVRTGPREEMKPAPVPMRKSA